MTRVVASMVVVAGLLSAVALAPAPAAQPRRVVTIAAGSVDGVYYPIAGAISRIASDTRSLNIRATVESSGGSLSNVQLIRAGEADFAFLQNDIAYYAFNGTGLEPFAGKPVKSMAGVFSVYPSAVHIVATRASGVKSVRDLKGKRALISVGSSASDALMRKYPFYTIDEIPANTYNHQEREIVVPAVMAML